MTCTLVAYATKHGATAEIAVAIGDGLRETGRMVDVLDAGEVRDIGPYDEVVIGSAVYMGKWQRDAVQFLERHERALARVPTWLFSSGPIGGTADADAKLAAVGAVSTNTPANPEVARLARRIGALGHATFPGRVGEEMNGLLERWLPRGDWRDLDAVRAWGSSLVAQP
jgi:menaquinone-dependent protoporphyrinogen oxidase